MEIEFDLPEWAEAFWVPNQYKIAYGGRNSTKTWTFARMLAFMADQQEQRILCARETQKSIEESVHSVLADQIKEIGLGHRYDILRDEIRHKFNGSRFAYVGLKQHTVANLKSYENFHKCWVAEAHKVGKYSWDILEPTIRTPGHEFWIDLNPELDSDETYDRFILNPPKGALVQRVTWRDNPWFTDQENEKRLRTKERDPIGYRNIWEGECRPAVEGAIYSQEIDSLQRSGRFTTVSHDPLLKTHTVWDLGWNDQTVILLVQRAASELRVIGAYIARFTEYADDIQALNAWALEKVGDKFVRPGVQWGTDYLPHDARATSKLAAGKTAEMTVKALGRVVQIVPNDYIENGIKQVRGIFSRLHVDKSCTDWLNALKRYHRHVTADGSKTGLPVHDDASHGADALRYLAQVADKLTNTHLQSTQKIKYQNLGMPEYR